ncbi:hypothetical protein AGMMS49965_15350 [Bacteroidia bacterium]|nr:hypothetical protein AGMMS49965_15350 [Bacteroidia bacterium]
MKKINSLLMALVLGCIAVPSVNAQGLQDMPATSPSVADDPANDVWYHIRTEWRTWGLNGNTGVKNEHSDGNKGYYLDQGDGRLLKCVSPSNELGTRWKFVSAGDGEYYLVSGLGNTIAYQEAARDWSPDKTYAGGNGDGHDRYYTSAADVETNVFTIANPNGAYLGLSLKGVGGIDKSNNDYFFDKYGPDATGGALSFVEAKSLDDAKVLYSPLDVPFADVANNVTSTKELVINGENLTTLKLELSGPDADAFTATSKAGALSTKNDTVVITYRPTTPKAYEAVLTISIDGDATVPPVTVNLTGNSDFTLPVITSSASTADEHWYYIQFYRRANTNKVLTSIAQNDTIEQHLLDPTADNQRWKIVEEGWDGYHLVNENGLEVRYSFTAAVTGENPSPEINRYVAMPLGFGDKFGWVRYNDTEDWQLKNTTTSAATTKLYLNDSGGLKLAGYNTNDAGNRLTFIDASAPKIVTPVETVDFGKVWQDKDSTITVQVAAIATGKSGIAAKITWAGTQAFSLEKNSLKAGGDSLVIKFEPAEANKEYKATLHLTSGTAEEVTIPLTGSSSMGLPSFSTDTDEHWYVITFKGKGTVIADKGLDAKVEHEAAIPSGAGADEQLWKFVGTSDNLKVVSKAGTELSFIWNAEETYIDPDFTEGDELRVITVAAGTGRPLYFNAHPDANWTLGFKAYEDTTFSKCSDGGFGGYLNAISATEVGLYMDYDNKSASNNLVFTPAENVSTLIAPVTFSTDTDETWYYMQFTRRAGDKKVVTNDGADKPLTQVAQKEGADALVQQWKFVGTTADFEIVARDGNKFRYVSASDKVIASTTGGGTFKFVGLPGNWQIKMETNNDGGNHLNDYQGNTVCSYDAGDGGAWLNFIPVIAPTPPVEEPETNDDGGGNDGEGDGTSIVDTPSDDVSEGTVVSTQYYNLQGIRVSKPVTSGIYIKRDVLDTGKVRTTKILHIQR